MNNVWYISLVAIVLLSPACGGNKKSSAEIKVSGLKDACDCNKALLVVVDELLELTKKFDNEEALMTDKEAAKKAEALFDKYEEIARHCEDELKLDAKRDKFDCERNNEKLEVKMKEVDRFF